MGSTVFRFDEFLLDPAIRELWRGDEEISLPPKVFGCLAYLIQHRDRAVGRDELISAVWGKTELADSVLGQAIVEARRALGDTGRQHRYIKTVRGFGYRWAAEVEPVTTGPGEAVAAPGWRAWVRVIPAILLSGVLVGGLLVLWQGRDGGDSAEIIRHGGESNIALILPVTVEQADHHSWIRFGAMELIAERLRAAGQPMVPSETVIALIRGRPDVHDAETLHHLTSATGAHLVLAATAEARASRWRVSLRSLHGAEPPITALGEAEDVLEAGRLAADRIALYLGLTPTPAPDAEPGLQLLVHQIEVARLAQQIDVARTLIESAEPALRRHPEIRFQLARMELVSYELDTAQAIFESLLKGARPAQDVVFRARILNGLGAVHIMRGDWAVAEPLLEEAALLLDGFDPLQVQGNLRMNLAAVALERDDLDAVRAHMAHARRIFESIGDVRNLASLEANIGVLEGWNERWPEALRHFESAIKRHVALNDVEGELMTHVNMVRAYLQLLNPQAASALEPRLNELINQVASPARVVQARLSLANLLAATGRMQAAQAMLADVLDETETRDDLHGYHMQALAQRAGRAEYEGHSALAGEIAGAALRGLLPDPEWWQNETRVHIWLILVRAHLAQGDVPAATAAMAALADWADGHRARWPRIAAALASAEVAATEGRHEAAEAAFERALALADASRVPLHLLRAAQSYIPWLLSADSPEAPDPERALLIADRIADYRDEHYEAALLQLQVYHAFGPPSAWRAAFERAAALAGERQIPAELRTPPDRSAPSR